MAKKSTGIAWEDNYLYTTPGEIRMGPCQGGSKPQGDQVSFSEALTVLSDPYPLTREDPQAAGEQRFVSLDLSDTGTLRYIDFSQAKRGAVGKPEPGKISIRLDNSVIEAFRSLADEAGGGNYQTLINDALVAYLHQHSVLVAVRKVVREAIGAAKGDASPTKKAGHSAQATP